MYKDETFQKAKDMMTAELMDAMGKFDAMRFVAIFFEIPMKNGSTIADFIWEQASLKREQNK